MLEKDQPRRFDLINIILLKIKNKKEFVSSHSAHPSLIAKLNSQSTYKQVNCITGKEGSFKMLNDKVENVFRFNRVRTVVSDVPTQGHKQVTFFKIIINTTFISNFSSVTSIQLQL